MYTKKTVIFVYYLQFISQFLFSSLLKSAFKKKLFNEMNEINASIIEGIFIDIDLSINFLWEWKFTATNK